ncbi:hypothetical protein EVAR_98807_1 [Eumeta japonica]|uniref:Uncharacterized protein n=1 Tax=Eumeta variegata TaxID=151549 RepID=A0A4C1XUX8_EUMVA|nr:hypothetical protein EVAR_98807_1 [Eumeta japonica]
MESQKRTVQSHYFHGTRDGAMATLKADFDSSTYCDHRCMHAICKTNDPDSLGLVRESNPRPRRSELGRCADVDKIKNGFFVKCTAGANSHSFQLQPGQDLPSVL